MINGTIRNREAISDLEVSASGQQPQQIEAVIDTGYNGCLTLPSNLVSALQLPFAGHRRGTLADGSVTRLDVYLASVVWHGQQREARATKSSPTPRWLIQPVKERQENLTTGKLGPLLAFNFPVAKSSCKTERETNRRTAFDHQGLNPGGLPSLKRPGHFRRTTVDRGQLQRPLRLHKTLFPHPMAFRGGSSP